MKKFALLCTALLIIYIVFLSMDWGDGAGQFSSALNNTVTNDLQPPEIDDIATDKTTPSLQDDPTVTGALVETDVLMKTGALVETDVLMKTDALVETDVLMKTDALVETGAPVKTDTPMEIDAPEETGTAVEPEVIAGTSEIKQDDGADNIRLIALTFDDGPSVYTTTLLNALRERDIKVTFFMVGNSVEKNLDIVLQAYADGHSINIHSYDHNDCFTELDSDGLEAQVTQTGNLISAVTGNEPIAMVRPPYGVIDLETAWRTGKANMLWDVDPRDWNVRNAQMVYDYIMENASANSVVLMHDTYETSVEAAIMVIDRMREDGWRFVTLDQLYELNGVELKPGGIYRNPNYYQEPQPPQQQITPLSEENTTN